MHRLPISVLLAAAETCTLGLLADACIATCNSDMLSTAFSLLVEDTVTRLAGHIDDLGNALRRISRTSLSALLKARTAGIVPLFRLVTSHLDIALTAASVLIVETG